MSRDEKSFAQFLLEEIELDASPGALRDAASDIGLAILLEIFRNYEEDNPSELARFKQWIVEELLRYGGHAISISPDVADEIWLASAGTPDDN